MREINIQFDFDDPDKPSLTTDFGKGVRLNDALKAIFAALGTIVKRYPECRELAGDMLHKTAEMWGVSIQENELPEPFKQGFTVMFNDFKTQVRNYNDTPPALATAKAMEMALMTLNKLGVPDNELREKLVLLANTAVDGYEKMKAKASNAH